MSILSGARPVGSAVRLVVTGRARILAVLAAAMVTLGLAIPAAMPKAHAEVSACPPTGTLWHFQNYTISGKTITLDGYSGPDGTGDIMITCETTIPKAEMSGWKSRGGEVWMPYDVQSVKITSRSDGGGDPVSAGPLDNEQNACFRIVYNNTKTSWELVLRNRGDKCDTN